MNFVRPDIAVLVFNPSRRLVVCPLMPSRDSLIALFRDRIGEIIGQDEAMQEYGWRASLSGIGAFFLCMFMMAVGAIGGFVAFSPDDR